MKGLIVDFEYSSKRLLQTLLELEAYRVIATRRVTEALQAITDSNDSYLLFADNIIFIGAPAKCSPFCTNAPSCVGVPGSLPSIWRTASQRFGR